MPATVRERSPFGPCNLLGELVHETPTRYYVYRRPNGVTAFACKRSLHLEPCPACPDHQRREGASHPSAFFAPAGLGGYDAPAKITHVAPPAESATAILRRGRGRQTKAPPERG
jgi:hypothetical protein